MVRESPGETEDILDLPPLASPGWDGLVNPVSASQTQEGAFTGKQGRRELSEVLPQLTM